MRAHWRRAPARAHRVTGGGHAAASQMIRPTMSLFSLGNLAFWILQFADDRLGLHKLVGLEASIFGTLPTWSHLLGIGISAIAAAIIRTMGVHTVREMWLTHKGACARIETYNDFGVRGRRRRSRRAASVLRAPVLRSLVASP